MERKNMSQSLFDKNPIKLPKPAQGQGVGLVPFAATGSLEHTAQSVRKERTVHVFVVIQQTKNGRRKAAIASGYQRQGPTKQLKSWSVPMTMDLDENRPALVAGDAVGIALSVEFSDDSAGFEVYPWCQQIELK
jgi:hypothetical protein